MLQNRKTEGYLKLLAPLTEEEQAMKAAALGYKKTSETITPVVTCNCQYQTIYSDGPEGKYYKFGITSCPSVYQIEKLFAFIDLDSLDFQLVLGNVTRNEMFSSPVNATVELDIFIAFKKPVRLEWLVHKLAMSFLNECWPSLVEMELRMDEDIEIFFDQLHFYLQMRIEGSIRYQVSRYDDVYRFEHFLLKRLRKAKRAPTIRDIIKIYTLTSDSNGRLEINQGIDINTV